MRIRLTDWLWPKDWNNPHGYWELSPEYPLQLWLRRN